MRLLPEWIAKSDDEAIPPRVRLRVFQKFAGVCPICHRNLRAGHWDLDHVVALALGGEHREHNLAPVCTSPCHRNKTRADVALKSHSYKRRASHAGIKRRKYRWGYGKDDPMKKKVDGQVVVRETKGERVLRHAHAIAAENIAEALAWERKTRKVARELARNPKLERR